MVGAGLEPAMPGGSWSTARCNGRYATPPPPVDSQPGAGASPSAQGEPRLMMLRVPLWSSQGSCRSELLPGRADALAMVVTYPALRRRCDSARAEGLEPPNAGFGDRCLGRLATPACIVLLSSYPAGTKRGTHRAGFWRAVGSSKIRDDSYRHMRATCRRWLRGNQALIPVFNARVSAPSA